MVILEGCRKSGKSFTTSVIENNFSVLSYKDLGMSYIASANLDPDDYSIGRDCAYAQFISRVFSANSLQLKRLFFDRQYWSSYVYGQAWRNKYDKTFWLQHIKTIELMWGEYIKKIKIILITPNEDDFKKMEKLSRKSDMWDDKVDYRKQHELYEEVFEESKCQKFRLFPFQSEKYIVQTFHDILENDF